MSADRFSKIRMLAERLAERKGLELVEVVHSPGRGTSCLRVLIHRPEGVSIQDCRRFSQELETLIEVEEAVRGAYVLEVSSPGITRSLVTPADFLRAVGRRAEINWRAADGNPATAEGIINGVHAGSVILATPAGDIEVGIDRITTAKPVIDWRELFRQGERKRSSEEDRHE